MNKSKHDITPDRFDAVLFDLDGVLTDTARVHAACWKKMFDQFLQAWAKEKNEAFHAFDIADDYKQYVDGKPRYDGVRSFLESRGIKLSYGDPHDAPDAETICGLGNRKNAMLNEVLEAEGVDVYQGSVDLVHRLHGQGIRTAVVSSSKNCEAILRAAGIADLFEVRVDGVVAAELKLAGKPTPDTYLKAVEQLGVSPKRAVVVEDAISGVEAGRRGHFGLVVGVDREGDADALKKHGADVVVNDLSEMLH
ncbi:MAG: HAD family hydrolase [Acidiferrobacterales bacterium]